MAGYTRQDTANNIANGNVIDADDINDEINAIVAAMNSSTGHNHDGSSTSGNGAPITKVGPAQEISVSSSAVLPKTTNSVDMGSSTLKFKDAFMAGDVSSATITTTGAATIGTNIDVGGTVDLGDWSIALDGTNLLFKYNNVSKMKLDADGNVTLIGTLTESGTI